MHPDYDLKVYREYQEGKDDFVLGGYRPSKYKPGVARRAYKAGYSDAKKENSNG